MATTTAFHQFVRDVKLTVDGTDYTFSCWNLSVLVHTYTGTDKIAAQLADGSWRQRIDGFHVEVVFEAEMQSVDNTDNVQLRDALEHIYNFGTGTLDLDPTDDAGNKTLTVVPSDGKGMSLATFRRGVRGRPVQFSLKTQSVSTTVPSWLMDEITNFPYEGTDTELLAIAGLGVTQGSGLITAWADQSAAGNDLTTASALTAVDAAFGAGTTAKLAALTSYIRTAGNQPLSAMAGVSAVGRIWMVVRNTPDGSTGDTILDITDTTGTNWTSVDIVAGLVEVNDSDTSTVSGTTDIGDSDPHLIEIEIDLANDTIKVHVDGTEEGSNTGWTGDLSGTSSATHYIQIGGDAAKRDAAFDTYIPFVMIDSATPDSTRIAAIRRFLARRYGIINLLSD